MKALWQWYLVESKPYGLAFLSKSSNKRGKLGCCFMALSCVRSSGSGAGFCYCAESGIHCVNSRLRLLGQGCVLSDVLYTLDLQDPWCNSSKDIKSNWRTPELFFFFSVCVLFPIYFGVFSVPPSPFSPGTSCPLLPVPAEFFHPAISATQTGPEKVSCAHNLPKISLQGSWASLRSPSVNCSLLHQVRSPACFCLKMLISTSHPKREAWIEGKADEGERPAVVRGWVTLIWLGGAQGATVRRRAGEETICTAKKGCIALPPEITCSSPLNLKGVWQLQLAPRKYGITSHFSSPLGTMHRVHCSHLHAQQPLCEPGRWQPHNHLSFSWCCGSGSHTCFAAGASPHLPPTQPLVPHHTLSLSSIFPWSLSSCIAERQSLSLSEKASISHREE